ncbi:DUF2975 domain-containing protein [uncultured Polaribacter sp.]|uniref:DUF2975 domain-containing protein n=1 Tax=uncultured Polaribacter sp. TaxID=174711 RepID=UPI00261D27A5|nr:DUF2975 domain-containing protein [uncultured Polaribacter sp.]
MLTIFQTTVLIVIFSIVGFLIYSTFQKKRITTFLYLLFNFGFWMMIVISFVALAFTLYTGNGILKTSKNSTINISNKKIPVNFSLSFNQGKRFTNYIKDSLGNTIDTQVFSRYSDDRLNFVNPDFFGKSKFTKEKLDSIFENSKDLEFFGKKIQFDGDYNENVSTKVSSISGKTNLKIETKNWQLSTLFNLKFYLSFIIIILILYYLKTLFQLLKTSLKFSLELVKTINKIASLIIIWQVLQLVFSFLFSFYFDHASFKNTVQSDVFLSISPHYEFDFTLIIVSLGLFVFSDLLSKANQIQQENDLTI